VKTGTFIWAVLISTLSYSAGVKGNFSRDSLSIKGQMVGWAGTNLKAPSSQQTGFRYIPSGFFQHNFNSSLRFDIEASVNAYINMKFNSFRFDKFQTGIKPYRLTGRISSNQWELRAGLQKISFGTATMLRPLMWFDQIDPRDPLQLTDGVYGLLGRYYFLNNINIWLWGLVGNKEKRGWDLTPPSSEIPEYGGRIQLPFLSGEMGISMHHRSADFRSLGYHGADSSDIPETRIGLDGKWDIGPGIWYEYVLKKTNTETRILSYMDQQLNIGSDYTFAVGNGLNLTAEHLLYSTDARFFPGSRMRNFSALMVSYPFEMTDRISLMVYYNYENNEWYRFLSLQRQYDKLSLYLMFFRNPVNFNLYSGSGDMNLFSGTGFQVMVTFNH
jgi:hypothetical protein